jgi:hypothetical protein
MLQLVLDRRQTGTPRLEELFALLLVVDIIFEHKIVFIKRKRRVEYFTRFDF